MSTSSNRWRITRCLRVSVLALSLGAFGLPPAAGTIDASGELAVVSCPLAATCQTTFAFTPTGSIHIEGTCRYSHLGLTSTVAEQIAIPRADGTLHVVNTVVYTAANGDDLFATTVGIGRFTATGVIFSGTETYRGGTGRFVRAEGSLDLAGGAEFLSPTTGVGHFSGVDSISY